MDFALADSALHFNDGKRRHAGIIYYNNIQDRIGCCIHSHFYNWANGTRRRSASVKKNTEKPSQKIDNLKGNKDKATRTITN